MSRTLMAYGGQDPAESAGAAMIVGALVLSALLQHEPAEEHVGTVRRSQGLRAEYVQPGLKPYYSFASSTITHLYEQGKLFFGKPKGYSVVGASVSDSKIDYRTVPGYGLPYANIFYLTPFFYDERSKAWRTDETATKLFQIVNGIPNGVLAPLAADPEMPRNGLFVLASPRPGSRPGVRIMEADVPSRGVQMGAALITNNQVTTEVSWATYFEAMHKIIDETYQADAKYSWAKADREERLKNLAEAEALVPEDQRKEPAKVGLSDGGVSSMKGSSTGYFAKAVTGADNFRIVRFNPKPGASAKKVNLISIAWTYWPKRAFSAGFAQKARDSYNFDSAKAILSK